MLRNTDQILSSGNTDSFNMQDPARVASKAFTTTLELRMAVEDSPSAAGNVLNAVRSMQRALDDGLSGVIDPLAALLVKAPREGWPRHAP